MRVIKIIEVMYFIDIFIAETPRGKYPWIKQNVLSLILFVPLGQIPKIKYAIWLRVNILRCLRGGSGLLPRMFLIMRRQLRIIPLIMMVLIRMKRMIVIQERRVREQVSLNQEQKRWKRFSGL